jgi:hypothetical protein
MVMQLFLVIVPLYLVLAWVANTWIRARHGYPLPGGATPRDERAEDRDALIARLEARIRVLERIATDSARELRAELDELERQDRRPPTS